MQSGDIPAELMEIDSYFSNVDFSDEYVQQATFARALCVAVSNGTRWPKLHQFLVWRTAHPKVLINHPARPKKGPPQQGPKTMTLVLPSACFIEQAISFDKVHNTSIRVEVGKVLPKFKHGDQMVASKEWIKDEANAEVLSKALHTAVAGMTPRPVITKVYPKGGREAEAFRTSISEAFATLTPQVQQTQVSYAFSREGEPFSASIGRTGTESHWTVTHREKAVARRWVVLLSTGWVPDTTKADSANQPTKPSGAPETSTENASGVPGRANSSGGTLIAGTEISGSPAPAIVATDPFSLATPTSS